MKAYFRKTLVIKGDALDYNKDSEVVAIFHTAQEARKHYMELYRKFGKIGLIDVDALTPVKMAI